MVNNYFVGISISITSNALPFKLRKGGVNLNFLKHIKSCNFQTITVMYIKVYISGMKMSQRTHFWYQILLKMLLFKENGKKHFLGKNFCDMLKKIILS